MYEIEKKENSKMEVAALLTRIRQHINAAATYYETYSISPKKIKAEQISTLKIHEYRMNEAIKWLTDINEKEWLENKEGLHKEFHEANNLLVIP